MPYDATWLHEELKEAGLPIVGCSSDGRVDWEAPPTVAQLVKAEEIKTAHDPSRRRREWLIRKIQIGILEAKIRDETAVPNEVRQYNKLKIEQEKYGGGLA